MVARCHGLNGGFGLQEPPVRDLYSLNFNFSVFCASIASLTQKAAHRFGCAAFVFLTCAVIEAAHESGDGAA